MKRTATIPAVVIAATLALAGCGSGPQSDAQAKGQEVTEQAFGQQSAAVPYPADELTDSLERRNLVERLRRTNNPNAIGYVYLLGDTGTYLGYYVIKGKVSSTQSQLTTDQLQVWTCRSSGCESNVVNAPGDDGSYGANEPGIFFFTTEGVMVTTDMRYVVTDAPLNVNAPKLNVPKG